MSQPAGTADDEDAALHVSHFPSPYDHITRSMSSPESPLSDISSEPELGDEVKPEELSVSGDIYHDTDPDARPSKRQRTSGGPSWDSRRDATPDPLHDIDTDVSEDTWGSVPESPNHPTSLTQDEEAMGQEQVSFCKWDECNAGDLGDMDQLVDHLHREHIGVRQKKYSCEWVDCNRKGVAHASGYALRAHMRSHTKEKPFYCSLPECDRAFTRSDALAKHMRTVHETEALRPSDPVPKHHSAFPANRFQRVKLVLNKANGTGSEKSIPDSPQEPVVHSNDVVYSVDPSQPDTYAISFPPDIQLTADERTMSANDLYQLLRHQLAWAQEEADELKGEVDELEKTHKDTWFRKELILESVMEAEAARMDRGGFAQKGPEQAKVMEQIWDDVKYAKQLPLTGEEAPWWRKYTQARDAALSAGGEIEVEPSTALQAQQA